jgi:hypothetical protein
VVNWEPGLVEETNWERWPALICKRCGGISDGPIDATVGVCACRDENEAHYETVEVVPAAKVEELERERDENFDLANDRGIQWAEESASLKARADHAEQLLAEARGKIGDLADAFDAMEDARSKQRGFGGARRFSRALSRVDVAVIAARQFLASQGEEGKNDG